MTPFLQLLVATLVAIGGAIIALRIDRKEHSDSRQEHIHFPKHDDGDLKRRGVAMSHTHL